MDDDNLLRTQKLTRHFGMLLAVNGVDLTVRTGELRAIIGPNGAGKSTFFKLISGELSPSAGRIFLGGRDITGMPQLPFSDMHYVMALLRAGDRVGAQRIVESMREYGAQETTYAPVVKAVSLPVAEAITAFSEGRYRETVDKLSAVQKELHRAGGSHAQRDVVTLTLIETALRAKRHDLARGLLDARTRARPTSPGSWQAFARALEATNDPAAAQQARAQAEALLQAS